MTSAQPFVLSEAFTSDLAVIEASAGTGKTFTLAALTVLAIGRGDCAIGQLCVTTFTDAATAELRGRLRSRLVKAATFLEAIAPEVEAEDDLERMMLGLDDADRAKWLENVRVAVRDFDTASITTIHGFCSRVIGAVIGTDPARPLTSDDDDVDEVVRDVLLARLDDPSVLQIDHARLLAVVRTSMSLSAARIHDIGPLVRGFDPDDPGHLERAARTAEVGDLVAACVAEVRRRRAARGVRTFDDLLADTRELLVGPQGPAIAIELRHRFRVVLIDEFQDTDQVQWDILRTAFMDPIDGTDPARVVIVGDPKQSIYRFRGAELSAYIDARRYTVAHDGVVSSLTTNFRTAQPLLDALNVLFRGFTFGDSAIEYLPVTASDPDGGPGFGGLPAAPLQFRSPDASITGADDVRAEVRADLGRHVIDLLDRGQIVDDRTGDWRSVRPHDIAILVGSNRDAVRIADDLRERQVPVVVSSSESVLRSPAAEQWRILLAALDRPSSAGRVRLAATSWFDGLDAARLAALDEPGAIDPLVTRDDSEAIDPLAALFDRYRAWSRILIDEGLPALTSALRAHGLSQRVLSRRSGERDLTDLEHIAELLQSRTSGRPTTAGVLLAILDELVDAKSDDALSSELYDRRIDRDDDTVRIMTVHKSKGLEFEIVLVPTMWSYSQGGKGKLSHGRLGDDRVIDVGYALDDGLPAPFDQLEAIAKDEEIGEDRRKLYVALTRAKKHLVVWMPLGYTRNGGNGVVLRDLLTHRTGAAFKTFDPAPLVEEGEGTIEYVVTSASDSDVRYSPSPPSPVTLTTATAPSIDRTWQRWSFTGITRVLGDHHAAASTFEVGGGLDEPSTVDDDSAVSSAPAVLPLRAIPGGKVFGTLVHSVLEEVDFASPDLVRDLRAVTSKLLRYRSVRGVTADDLAEGLDVALRAPLGGPLGPRSLTDLKAVDRRNELVFDLPLSRFDVADIANEVLPHLDADDPFRVWFDTATTRHLRVEGMLNGSIDLVARTMVEGQPRYWLADYKTNVVADGIEFERDDLVVEMIRDDYVLQSTVYQVALHRFLRWRLGEAYDPATHLLGSAYLFVRGMDPARDPGDARGVVWWQLPLPALEALDALFAGADEVAV